MKQIKNITAAEILKQIKLTVICGEEITETNVCDGFSTWMEQFDASNPYEAFTPKSREYFQNKLFVAFAAGMLPAEVTETRTNEVGPDGCCVFTVETAGALNPYEEAEEETEETETEPASPSAPSANEETTAPAEEQTTTTTNEEEEEEQTMKPEVIFSRIREEVEARTERSAWSRGVTAYALDLVDELEEATEGGYFDMSDLEAPKLVDRALLNGAADWNQYSWGGSSLCYDGQIAERLCTPSELKRTRGGERRPNSREEWLDTQARALYQAASRVKKSIRAALEA